MSSATRNPGEVPAAVVAGAGRASLLLLLGPLVILGVSDKWPALVPLSAGQLLMLVLVTSVVSLAVGVAALVGRRSGASGRGAVLGVTASATLFVVVGVASLSGAASARETERELALAGKALRDYPGWNGGAALADGVVLSASEIDARSDLARILLRNHGKPYRILLLNIDNRKGTRELTVDLDGTRLRHAGGARVSAVPSAAADVRVAPGESSIGDCVLFPDAESFLDVQSVDVKIDGATRSIPGRYFTLDERRAIDAQRR